MPYQLLGLDALDVLVEGDRGLRLVREGVPAVARRVRHASRRPRPGDHSVGLG